MKKLFIEGVRLIKSLVTVPTADGADASSVGINARAEVSKRIEYQWPRCLSKGTEHLQDGISNQGHRKLPLLLSANCLDVR